MANIYYNSSPSYAWPHHSSLSPAPSHHFLQQLPIFWHSLQSTEYSIKLQVQGSSWFNCIIYIQIACLISFVCFITVNGFWWLISLFTLLSKKKTVLDLLWVPIVSLDLSNSIWFCNLNFWFSNSSLFLALSCCDLNSLSSNCLKEEKTQYM